MELGLIRQQIGVMKVLCLLDVIQLVMEQWEHFHVLKQPLPLQVFVNHVQIALLRELNHVTMGI